MVRELLDAASRERDGDVPAGAPFRDRPARRRLEDLARHLVPTLRASLEGWRPIAVATAELLAAEQGWLLYAARLRAEALDLVASPEELTAELRVLAGLTDGRPVAARAAAEALTSRLHRSETIAPASFHAAATVLAADARTSSGLLAGALATGAGPVSGWDQGWRAVVGTLRAHPDADVAEAALELRMGQG